MLKQQLYQKDNSYSWCDMINKSNQTTSFLV